MAKTVNKGWVYSTTILAWAVGSLSWEKHQTAKALKNVFSYCYRVTLVDADSGEVLPAGVAGPLTSSADLFQQSQGTTAHSDGSVTISGVGYTPRKFTFTSGGYESESLTIGPDSPFTDEIQIRLNQRQGSGPTESGKGAGPSDGGKPPS